MIGDYMSLKFFVLVAVSILLVLVAKQKNTDESVLLFLPFTIIIFYYNLSSLKILMAIFLIAILIFAFKVINKLIKNKWSYDEFVVLSVDNSNNSAWISNNKHIYFVNYDNPILVAGDIIKINIENLTQII